MVRVIVLDRDRLSSRIVSDRLRQAEGVEVVASVASLDEAMGHADEARVDVVAARALLPGYPALALCHRARKKGTGPAAVVYGVPDDSPTFALSYLEAGARASVKADADAEELVVAVTEAGHQRVHLEPPLAYRIVLRLAELSQYCVDSGLDPSKLRALTRREREVLELVGQELTNAQVAARLEIGVGTVKSHVHSILQKLEVESREEAARYLIMASLEPGEESSRGP